MNRLLQMSTSMFSFVYMIKVFVDIALNCNDILQNGKRCDRWLSSIRVFIAQPAIVIYKNIANCVYVLPFVQLCSLSNINLLYGFRALKSIRYMSMLVFINVFSVHRWYNILKRQPVTIIRIEEKRTKLNRVAKNGRTTHKWAKRSEIECFCTWEICCDSLGPQQQHQKQK